jgi:glycyl-tRNA synthetase beta subunit
VANQKWDKALEVIAGLNQPVSELFTAVMVNDPDETVRKFRHALLRKVLETTRKVADFSAFQVT